MSVKQFTRALLVTTGLSLAAWMPAIAQDTPAPAAADSAAATVAGKPADATKSSESGTDSDTAKAPDAAPADAPKADAAAATVDKNAAEGSAAAQKDHATTASDSPAAKNDAAAAAVPVGGSAEVGQSAANAAPADQNGHVGNGGAPVAHPSTESELHHQDWPFDGIFGTYDRAALQRGFQVYKQVCSACHSMNLLSYRNLEDIGYTEGQVKAIAAQYQVNAEPNDEGEITQRPALPSDHFKAPFANKKAAQAANNGAAPPDMSLLVKAREGGPDYIYSILTGYADPPKGVTLQPGQYYNTAIAGHVIAMPPPLTTAGQVQYEGATGVPNTVDQNARDVASFLAWTSEPHMEQRKRSGTAAIIFLLVLSAVSYAYKRRVWKDVRH